MRFAATRSGIELEAKKRERKRMSNASKSVGENMTLLIFALLLDFPNLLSFVTNSEDTTSEQPTDNRYSQ